MIAKIILLMIITPCLGECEPGGGRFTVPPAVEHYVECVESGGECRYSEARITTYVPEWAGINCDHDCSVGAWSIPLEENVSAACGPSLPFETKVYIYTPWGEVIERLCHDRGGAVRDWLNVDVYMTPEQHEERPLYGHSWPVVWELPKLEQGEGFQNESHQRGVSWRQVQNLIHHPN